MSSGSAGVPLGGCPTDAVATRFDRCASGVAGTGLAGRRILHVDRDANIDHRRFELEPQHDRVGVAGAVVVHDRRTSPGAEQQVRNTFSHSGSVRGRSVLMAGAAAPLLHVAAPTLRLDPSALAASGRLGGPAWLLDNTGVVDAPAESFECDLTVANLGALVVDGDADNVAELCSNPFTKRRRHCRRVVQAEDGIDLGVRPVGVLTARSSGRDEAEIDLALGYSPTFGHDTAPREALDLVPRRAGSPESSIMGRLPVRLDHRCRPSLRLSSYRSRAIPVRMRVCARRATSPSAFRLDVSRGERDDASR